MRKKQQTKTFSAAALRLNRCALVFSEHVARELGLYRLINWMARKLS